MAVAGAVDLLDPGPQPGSAMKESALDITIRTVAVVLWASLRSSERVWAHWRAPAAVRMRSGTSGSAPDTQAATVRRS